MGQRRGNGKVSEDKEAKLRDGDCMAALLNLSRPSGRLEKVSGEGSGDPRTSIGEWRSAIGQQILVALEFQLKPNRGRGNPSCEWRVVSG